MSKNTFENVSPSEKDLLLPINLPCPEQSCKSSFHNSSHLRLHLLKHHKIESDFNKSCKQERRFYCPRIECKYYLTSSGGLHFRSMQLLRQHFLKVHAEKTLACSNCSSQFASNALLSTHSMRCGTSFRCATCDWVYGSHEALTTHCRRKKHQMPSGGKSSVSTQNPIAVQSKTTQTIQTTEPVPSETVFLDVWQKRAQTQSTLVQTMCSNPVPRTSSNNEMEIESNGFSTNSCSVQTDFNLNGFNASNTPFVSSFAYEDNYCHIETQTDAAGLGESSLTDNNRLSPMIYADIHTQTQCDEFMMGWTHIETQTCWSPAPDDFTEFLTCTSSQTQTHGNLSSTNPMPSLDQSTLTDFPRTQEI